MMLTRTFISIATLLSVIPSSATPPALVTVVTVCEVMADLAVFNGKTIAIAGRWSASDEGAWLSEEQCDKKLQTNGFTWPNTLWLQYHPSAPSRVDGKRLTDTSSINAKIRAVVARTT